MDHSQRLSRSMPSLLPRSYISPIGYRATSSRWSQRHHQPRHYYIGGVRTTLIGAGSYPNIPRYPQRLIVCGAGVTLHKVTKNSSALELSRSGVFRSTETVCGQRTSSRAASCGDVFREAPSPTWDCRFSESGVSLNDSHTDVGSDCHTDCGSVTGLEDVDAASQCSFGSSSAFHELTCDSELDPLDSDAVSVAGSTGGMEQTLDTGEDEDFHFDECVDRLFTESKESILREVLLQTTCRDVNRPEMDKRDDHHSTYTKEQNSLSARGHFPGVSSENPSHDSADIPQTSFCKSPNHRPNCAPIAPSARFSKHPTLPRDSSGSPPTNTTLPLMTGKREQEKPARQRWTESNPGTEDPLRQAQYWEPSRPLSVTSSQNPCKPGQPPPTGDDLVQNNRLASELAVRYIAATEPLPLISKRRALNTQLPHQLPPQPPRSGLANSHPWVTEWVRLLEAGPMVKIPSSDCVLLSIPEETGSGCGCAKDTENRRRQLIGVCGSGSSPAVTKTSTVAVTQEEGAGRGAAHSPATSSDHLLCGGGGQQPSFCGRKENASVTSSPFFAESKMPACRPSAGEERKSEDGGKKWARHGAGIGKEKHLLNCGSVHEGLSRTLTPSPQLAADTTCENSVISVVNVSLCDEEVTLTTDPLNCVLSSDANNLAGREKGSCDGVTGGNRDTTTAYRKDNTNHVVTCEDKDSDPVFPSELDQSSRGGAFLQREEEVKECKEKTGSAEREGGCSSVHNNQCDFAGNGVPPSPSCPHTCSCDESRCFVTHCVNCSPPLPNSPAPTPALDRCILPFTVAEACQQVGNARLGLSTQAPTVLSTHLEGLHHALPDKAQHSQDVDSVDFSDRLCPQNSSSGKVGRRHVCLQDHDEVVTPVCHCTGSPLGVGEGRASSDATKDYCQGQAGKGFFVSDTATVREEGKSEREEHAAASSSTRGLGPFIPGEWREQEQTHPSTDALLGMPADCGSVTTAPADTGLDTHLSSPSLPSCTQDGHYRERNSAVMAGKGQSNKYSDSFSLLDSLEQQLSLLSSDDAFFTSDPQLPAESGQVSWYRDHAEASLPHMYSHTEAKSRLVQGSGSVPFTQEGTQWQQQTTPVSRSVFSSFDKREANTTEWNTDHISSHGSLVSETKREARHGRVSQVLSTTWGGTLISEEGGRGGTGDDGSLGDGSALSSSQRIRWQPPVSSSEQEDSDGNYTSVSSTDSSHCHSDSEFLTSDYEREDYDNVDSFSDFVSGLQGQCTSDRPSQHHRTDLVTSEFRSSRLRSCIQETILEADDESETADEADTTSTTISSFRSTFHYSLPHSTPKLQAASSVPEIKLWSTDQHVVNLSASEDRANTMSPVHPLQDLSDRLSSFSDASFELTTLQESYVHDDLSESRQSACASPTPSDLSEGSVYFSSATAEVRKQAERTTRTKLAESSPTLKVTRRNLTSAFHLEASKKARWIQDNVVLFQKLLADFEAQRRTSEELLMEEMISLDSGRNGDDRTCSMEKESDLCGDLYRSFTQETLEKRQNHVCPFVEEHLPVIRFKRFLKKKHNCKLKGRRTFRVRHQLDQLTESPLPVESGGEGVSEMEVDRREQSETNLPTVKHSPCRPPEFSSPLRIPNVVMSDVITDDTDVRRSFSDSAYSTLSEATSRHVTDLDSTLRSPCSSRGDDVSSIATDLSMDSDKLTSLSDVFDQLDVCEGEIDQALQVGHYKADTL